MAQYLGIQYLDPSFQSNGSDLSFNLDEVMEIMEDLDVIKGKKMDFVQKKREKGGKSGWEKNQNPG